MSKLYQKYLSLKANNNTNLYLFKSGIFYIFLDEDAQLMSPILNLKLTNFTPTVLKCGFPTSTLDKYLQKMKSTSYEIQIIDSIENTSYTPQNYNLSISVKNLINKILSINPENLSIKDCYLLIDELIAQAKNLDKC